LPNPTPGGRRFHSLARSIGEGESTFIRGSKSFLCPPVPLMESVPSPGAEHANGSILRAFDQLHLLRRHTVTLPKNARDFLTKPLRSRDKISPKSGLKKQAE